MSSKTVQNRKNRKKIVKNVKNAQTYQKFIKVSIHEKKTVLHLNPQVFTP